MLRGLGGHLFRQNGEKGRDRLGQLPADPLMGRFQYISHRASPLRDGTRMPSVRGQLFPSRLANKHTPGTSQYLFKLYTKRPCLTRGWCNLTVAQEMGEAGKKGDLTVPEWTSTGVLRR